MNEKKYTNFLNDKESFDQWHKLFNAKIAADGKFPITGDVLFLRSKSVVGKHNVAYQRIRRPTISKQHFRFTHVGLVISGGIVVHSLPKIGTLEKQLMDSLGNTSRKIRKSGITIDSLLSSGFLNPEAIDFMVFRNTIIAEDIDMQRKIINKAFYFFGVDYNFAIDHKERIFEEEYANLRLHCSEFVQQVLSASITEQFEMPPSQALPVDIYMAIINNKNWNDITTVYRSKGFNVGDEVTAKTHLAAQIFLSQVRSNQLQSALHMSKYTNLIIKLMNKAKLEPESLPKEFSENWPEHSLKDQLKSCYRLLTDSDLTIKKIHIEQNVIEKHLKESQEDMEHLAKENFTLYVTLAFRGLMTGAMTLDLISRDCESIKEDIKQHIEHLTSLAQLLPGTLDDAIIAKSFFFRFEKMKQRHLENKRHLSSVFLQISRICSEFCVSLKS